MVSMLHSIQHKFPTTNMGAYILINKNKVLIKLFMRYIYFSICTCVIIS